jgi:hypothetical protein
MNRKVIDFPGRSPQQRGRDEEKLGAASVGARLVPGSGSGGRHLLDYRGKRILWSNKATTKSSTTLSVPEKDLDEARAAARSRGCMWAYRVEFNGRHYVIQEEGDWHEIAESEEPEIQINNNPSEAKRRRRLDNATNPRGGAA